METNSDSIIIDNYVITKLNGENKVQICKISWFENKTGRSTSSLIKISTGSKLNDNLIISELSDKKITYDDIIDAWTRGKISQLTRKYKNIIKCAMEAPQLPPLPFIVEPTHFYSSFPLYEILNTLKDELSTKNIKIIDFNPSKSKFRCEYSYRNESTQFIIQIFKDSGYHLIEISPRGNSKICFSYAYDLVALILHNKTMIDHNLPRSSQSFHQFKPCVQEKRRCIYDTKF